MDFTDLKQKTREAELDHREIMSLLKFYNFLRERNGESQVESDYDHIFDELEEVYPDLTFRSVDYKIFAKVRPGVEGSLVEKIGFVSSQVPHLATTVTYDFESIYVVFRADGIGIIREDSCYEFFEHELDLAKVREECNNDEDAIRDHLHDYFLSEISQLMEDPFFDPSTEGHELYFETGSQEQLDRLMRLFILTEPNIEKHTDSQVCLFAGMEDNASYLEDDHSYSSNRLKKLTEIALLDNHPIGWTWEYNDGAYYRQSGYDQCPVSITWEINEVLEQASAREKMAARRELREYLGSRGFDLAKFDRITREGSAV